MHEDADGHTIVRLQLPVFDLDEELRAHIDHLARRRNRGPYACRSQPHGVISRSGASVGPFPLGGGSCLPPEVFRDHRPRPVIALEAPAIDPERTTAQVLDGHHVVADEQHRPAGARDVAASCRGTSAGTQRRRPPAPRRRSGSRVPDGRRPRTPAACTSRSSSASPGCRGTRSTSANATISSNLRRDLGAPHAEDARR